MRQQMDTFHAAENAAKLAKFRFEDEQELQRIWKRICLGEYISADGEHVEIQPPSMLAMEVADTFKNHPYHSKFIDDQALETTPEALRQELAAARAASKAEEKGMRTRSSSTTEQRRRLLALAQVAQVHFPILALHGSSTYSFTCFAHYSHQRHLPARPLLPQQHLHLRLVCSLILQSFFCGPLTSLFIRTQEGSTVQNH